MEIGRVDLVRRHNGFHDEGTQKPYLNLGRVVWFVYTMTSGSR